MATKLVTIISIFTIIYLVNIIAVVFIYNILIKAVSFATRIIFGTIKVININ